MYRVTICDRDGEGREYLERLIRCYFVAKGLAVSISKFSSGEDMLRQKGHVDIAFLSLEEDGSNVISAGYALIKQNLGVHLYVISSRYKYLDAAMDLKAFRYFDKPLDIDRLYASLDVITNGSGTISFVSEHLPVTLREDEIVCVFSSERKTCVLTDGGRCYPTTLTMKKWLEKIMNFTDFAQPHYSYIVNLKFVSEFDGNIIRLRTKSGKSLEVFPSQRKVAEFRRLYSAMSR